jgi:ABC-type multidrug transport system fused ATPase/permease subunit
MEIQEVAGGVMVFHIIFMLIFMAFGMCALIFWIWMLIDCLKNEDSDGNDKIIWILVIILMNWIGALIYFFVRRSERKGK